MESNSSENNSGFTLTLRGSLRNLFSDHNNYYYSDYFNQLD
jgi:hypothetical protein